MDFYAGHSPDTCWEKCDLHQVFVGQGNFAQPNKLHLQWHDTILVENPAGSIFAGEPPVRFVFEGSNGFRFKWVDCFSVWIFFSYSPGHLCGGNQEVGESDGPDASSLAGGGFTTQPCLQPLQKWISRGVWLGCQLRWAAGQVIWGSSEHSGYYRGSDDTWFHSQPSWQGKRWEYSLVVFIIYHLIVLNSYLLELSTMGFQEIAPLFHIVMTSIFHISLISLYSFRNPQ